MSTATTIARTHTPTRVSLVVAVVFSILAMLVATPAEAAVDSNAEAQFVSLINQERAARGLPKLQVASDLVSVARKHSARMAADNDLYHNPNLGSDVSGWQKVGENVGRGPSVSSIHDAFMNSSGHRANILDADWTEVGVGVEVVDGRIWVTEVFRQPENQTSEPAPEPEETEESKPAKKQQDDEPAPAPAPEESEAAPSTGSTGSSDGGAKKTGSGSTHGAGSDEGSDDPAPLPALADRTMAVMVRVERVEQDS